jgi:TolB protein
MRACILVVVGVVAVGVAAAPSRATSPGKDGRIAFRRYFDAAHTRGAIFTINADGSGERQITHPPADTLDDQPDWSPDGSRLVFSRCPHNTDCRIYTIRADGSGLSRVSPHCPAPRCGGDDVPAFAPDGRHVAFGRFDHNYGCCAIVVTDLQGRHLHVVTKGKKPYAIVEPQFSPDGKQIAFIEIAEPADRPRAIFVVNSDGSGLRRLTPWTLDAGDNPDWSPDGEKILFRSNVNIPGKQSQIYTIRADGSHLTQLTHFREGAIVTSSTFSPSGILIVFATTGLAGNADLFTMNADGSNVRRITRTRLWDSAPDWGPRTR